jgi:pimeloyl-ACP methyl ester carboxylesterase
VPALVVWGEEDRATPVHLARRVAHDLDAELVTVPGVGHFVHEEAPEALARAILDLAGPAERPAIGADPQPGVSSTGAEG